MTQQYDIAGIQNAANYAAKAARDALALSQANSRIAQETLKNTQLLAQTVAQMSAQRTGANPALQYVENIPGRRIPFDQLVAIPVGANVTSEVQGSITINQNGPFVAVARYCFLLSQMSFQYTDPTTGTPTIFSGRSYGRWRPTHSAWDLYDGVPRSEVVQAVPAPGAGAPHIISPSNASSWRSMGGDFNIELRNEGTGYARSNLAVPSPAYTKQINSPFPLGALDVFERGEVITFKVQPLHPNNPSYGNVQSFTGPGNNWPFLSSQFDAVEGIDDEIVDDSDVTTDPVARLANSILYIGLHGYIIVQPPGAGPY